MYKSLSLEHIYHLDGNNKFKCCGLCINGVVDGLSHKISWLVACSTNNHSLVTGNYFLQCIKKTKNVTVALRMGKDRENIFCEDFHFFFTGIDDSYPYAVSMQNEQIESFWSKVVLSNWWILFFERIVNEGVYHSQLKTHAECLLFWLLPIIQLEVNDVVKN